jgi:ribosomal protein S18 acetylase RimI-like enzyme
MFRPIRGRTSLPAPGSVWRASWLSKTRFPVGPAHPQNARAGRRPNKRALRIRFTVRECAWKNRSMPPPERCGWSESRCTPLSVGLQAAGLPALEGSPRSRPGWKGKVADFRSRDVSAAGTDLRIRPAGREDIPAIVMCATTSASEVEYAGFGRPWSERTFTDARRISAAWQEQRRAVGEEVYVAEVQGRVVGYVRMRDRGRELELVNIDVARDYQGRGIGRGLVRTVEERARHDGKTAVTLGTSRNAAGVPWKAFPWWQSLGYRVTGEEENAWTRSIGQGVREIRMRKDLL